MKKKIIIYYIVVVLFILLGFVVGRWEYETTGGYKVYYGEAQPTKLSTGEIVNRRNYGEIGDITIRKRVGWYRSCFISYDEYLLGNDKENAKVISYDLANQLVADGGANFLFSKEDFKSVYYHIPEIIISCIIWIFLLVLPIIFSKFLKIKNKVNIKKNLQKLKELDDIKQQGLISEEQYIEKREKLIKETKDKI